MRRRQFITGLGAAAMPLAAVAQQRERVRRVGVILPATADDMEFQTFLGAFLQALAQLGWTIGHNLKIEVRWATGNSATIRKYAAELAALAPGRLGRPDLSAMTQADAAVITGTIGISNRSGD